MSGKDEMQSQCHGALSEVVQSNPSKNDDSVKMSDDKTGVVEKNYSYYMSKRKMD